MTEKVLKQGVHLYQNLETWKSIVNSLQCAMKESWPVHLQGIFGCARIDEISTQALIEHYEGRIKRFEEKFAAL
jgi:hypothetical protein